MWLIHGWGGRAAQLSALAFPLAAAGFRVSAVDLPGHGGAPSWQTNGFHIADGMRDRSERVLRVRGEPGGHHGTSATGALLVRSRNADRRDGE